MDYFAEGGYRKNATRYRSSLVDDVDLDIMCNFSTAWLRRTACTAMLFGVRPVLISTQASSPVLAPPWAHHPRPAGYIYIPQTFTCPRFDCSGDVLSPIQRN